MSPIPGDGRHRLAAIAAVFAGLVLLGLSGSIAHAFGAILGSTETDKQILGALNVALNACKVILPFGIFAAWRQSRHVLMAVGIAAWGFAVVNSLISSYGYGAVQREKTEQSGFAPNQARVELASLPKYRPAASIRPLLKQKKLKPDTRAELESELATAEQAEKLKAILTAPTGESSSAQIASIAAATSLEPAKIRASFSAVLSVTTELCEASLFMLASLLWFGSAPLAKERLNVPEPEEQATPEKAPTEIRGASLPTRQTMALWIEGFLDTNPRTTAKDAFDAYCAEWARRRRKASTKPKFLKALDKAATARGAHRTSVAGRVQYQIAA